LPEFKAVLPNARLYEAWPKPDKLAAWKQKLATLDEAEARKNNPARA
jgi:hypothetical protein